VVESGDIAGIDIGEIAGFKEVHSRNTWRK
jgi:hypothetical protein